MPDKKMKILVTGFAPFEDDLNISGEVVRRLRITNPQVEIIPLVLSAEYLKAEAQITRAITKEKPDFVISLGELNGERKPGIQIKTTADSNSFSPDSRGDVPHWKNENGGELVHCSNPVLNGAVYQSYARHFLDADRATIDHTPGAYLCNDTFYTVLMEQATHGKPGQAIFLHLSDITLSKTADPKRLQAIKGYTQVVADLIDSIANNPAHYLLNTRYSVEQLPAKNQPGTASQGKYSRALKPNVEAVNWWLPSQEGKSAGQVLSVQPPLLPMPVVHVDEVKPPLLRANNITAKQRF